VLIPNNNGNKFQKEKTETEEVEEEEKYSIRTSEFRRRKYDWRTELLEFNPYAIAATSLECENEDANVFISWHDVVSTSLISASVMSIVFKIHRCFPSNGDNKNISNINNSNANNNDDNNSKREFKQVEIEVFVSNCPAIELKVLIEERMSFFNNRRNMKFLLQSKSLHGTKKIINNNNNKNNNNKNNNEEEEEEEEEGIFETEDLSLGAQLYLQLDQTSDEIEFLIQKKYEANNNNNHNTGITKKYSNEDIFVWKECSVVIRKNARLQAYMSCLVSFGLEDHRYEYNLETMKKIVAQDCERCKKIELNEEVATANNKIEFLLDKAEQRLRDAALCGWKNRGGEFEECVQWMVNSYFIEIVGILGY
jgi:hypothetical protein